MAFNNQIFGILDQVLDQVDEKQPKRLEKSNTIVVGAGVIIAALLGGLTQLIESGVDWVPTFAPTLVTMLTFMGTALKIYYTKNGLTPSIKTTIKDTIAEMIDQAAEASPPAVGLPEPVAPVVVAPAVQWQGAGVPLPPAPVEDAAEIAQDLDDLAKQYAERV